MRGSRPTDHDDPIIVSSQLFCACSVSPQPKHPTSEMSAFDRGVRPVMKIVLPEKAEEVIEFQADPELQSPIEELARKSTETH